MKILQVLCKAILIIGLTACSSFSNKEEKNQLEAKLLNMWEEHKFISLTNLLKKPYEKICVVGPYGSKVIEKRNSYEVEKMNEYLKSIHHVNNEGTWSLVLFNDNAVELFEFHRKNIDIFDSNKVKYIPENFVEKTCSTFKDEYFYLLTVDERKYVILGAKK